MAHEMKYRCGNCEFRTNDQRTIDKHIRSVHEQTRALSCRQCDFRSTSKDTMNTHLQSHTRPQNTGHQGNKQVCRYFINGNCKFGTSCRFKHSGQSSKFSSKYHKSNDENVQQCKYYERCQQFPFCKYKHNEICKYQNNCRKGNLCRKVHLSQNQNQQVSQKKNPEYEMCRFQEKCHKNQQGMCQYVHIPKMSFLEALLSHPLFK
jgi:hypothetical protein